METWLMMHTYFDIMADTAGFRGRMVHCPVWIIATVQPQLHRGVDVIPAEKNYRTLPKTQQKM